MRNDIIYYNELRADCYHSDSFVKFTIVERTKEKAVEKGRVVTEISFKSYDPETVNWFSCTYMI